MDYWTDTFLVFKHIVVVVVVVNLIGYRPSGSTQSTTSVMKLSNKHMILLVAIHPPIYIVML